MKILKIGRAQEITPEKLLFAAEYLKDFNGVAAVKRVKPAMSTEVASSTAKRYLSQECVRRELTRHIRKVEEHAEVTVAMVIKELHAIATTNLKDAFYEDGTLMPIDEMPESLQKAISGMKIKGPTKEDISYIVEIKLWEKTKALELLGKHLAMWMDKLQLSGDFVVEMGHLRPAIDVEAERGV